MIIMTFPTHLTIPYSTGEVTVPIHEATMQQAVDWMNAPTHFPERIERRFILKNYIGASLDMRIPSRPRTIILYDSMESNSPEGG